MASIVQVPGNASGSIHGMSVASGVDCAMMSVVLAPAASHDGDRRRTSSDVEHPLISSATPSPSAAS